MNPETLKQIADYFTGLGTLFEVLAADSASGPERPAGPVAASPAAAPASTFSDGSPIDELPDEDYSYPEHAPLPKASQPTGDQGSLAQCPKHRREYLPSKFKEGEFYCPEDSDEPKWTNRKGKCQITPKSAGAWLAQHAGAAA